MVCRSSSNKFMSNICRSGSPWRLFVCRWRPRRRFLPQPRRKVGFNILFLYPIFNILNCISFVKSRYDPKENKWTKVASMMTRRLGVAVAVLHGYLYAIGGSDGQNPLNSVERYDPQKNTWTVMAPMSTRRKHLGCAVYNNMIYAVGGRDDCTELSSAERYWFWLKKHMNAEVFYVVCFRFNWGY